MEDKKPCDLEAALEAAQLQLSDKLAAAYLRQTHNEPRWVLKRKVEDQASIDRASVEMLRREEPDTNREV